MSFRFVFKLVTLNGLQRCNDPTLHYFNEFDKPAFHFVTTY